MQKKFARLAIFIALLGAMLYIEFTAFSPIFAVNSQYPLYLVLLAFFAPTVLLAGKIAGWINEPSDSVQ